jgi:hypothetical protein
MKCNFIQPEGEPKEKNARKRAISVKNILDYHPKVMDFQGCWFDSFGKPEMKGCWLVWGASGNGKTRFALQLCKNLTQFGKVAYNSLEEGLSLSFQNAIRESGMIAVKNKFVLLDKEPIADLIERLREKKSADIVIIDSIQYSGLNMNSAKGLTDMFPRKLFVFISHADGQNPSGRTAKAVRFHADVKARVEGYKIPNPVSRFKEGICKPFVIWEQGVEMY